MTQRVSLFFSAPRPIVRLFGRDLIRYLHGRTTQDIKALTPGTFADALVLTPQGRIQAHLRFLRRAEDIIALSDPLPSSDEAELLAALFQFRVADDIQCDSWSDTTALLHLVGSDASSVLTHCAKVADASTECPTAAELFGTFLEIPLFGTKLFAIGTRWGKIPGIDILVDRTILERLTEILKVHPDVVIGDDRSFTELRIESRIPLIGAELTEETLGPDIPIEHLVSFRKGCYAGQEVIEMATARGRPNRRLVRLTGAASGTDAANAVALRTALTLRDPEAEGGSSGKTVGIVTSSVLAEDGQTISALGFVRISVPDDAILRAGELELRIVPAESS